MIVQIYDLYSHVQLVEREDKMKLTRFELAELAVEGSEKKVEKLKRKLDEAKGELNAAYAERSAANAERLKEKQDRGFYQHGQGRH